MAFAQNFVGWVPVRKTEGADGRTYWAAWCYHPDCRDSRTRPGVPHRESPYCNQDGPVRLRAEQHAYRHSAH